MLKDFFKDTLQEIFETRINNHLRYCFLSLKKKKFKTPGFVKYQGFFLWYIFNYYGDALASPDAHGSKAVFFILPF
jgi:hypothetical protein